MMSKGQALLEMAELDDAVKLVDFHSTMPANVRYTLTIVELKITVDSQTMAFTMLCVCIYI